MGPREHHITITKSLKFNNGRFFNNLPELQLNGQVDESVKGHYKNRYSGSWSEGVKTKCIVPWIQ